MAKDTTGRRPPHDRIRELAYRLYELRGRQDGKAVEDWLSAEVQLATDPHAYAHAAAWFAYDDGGTS